MSAIFARHRPVWLAAVGLLVAGSAVLGWRHYQRDGIIARSIPPRPDLAGRPAELRERIARAESAARAGRTDDTGLAALSRLYHANGLYNEAIQCYEGLGQLEPKEARWPYLLGSILASYGRLDAALPQLELTVRLVPDHVAARLRLGDILIKSNRAAEAKAVYAAALVREPGNPYALLGLARCAIAVGDWSQARDHLTNTVRLHRDFSGAIMLLVTVHEHFGDIASADALRGLGMKEFLDFSDPWLEDLVVDCFDPYRLSVVAAVKIFAGDNATAERLLQRAITHAPEAGTYRRQLGKLYYQQKKYEPARENLERAVASGPMDTEAWSLLIDLLGVVGDGPALERALASGLANNPESASMHYALANRLNKAGRYDEAIAAYTRARSLKPDEVRPFVDLAMIYFRLDRIDEGVKELRGALVAEPGHPLPMGMLARHCIITGDEAAARQWIGQLRLLARMGRSDLESITTEFRQRFGRNP